jgi:hypothetical protein
MSLNAQAAVRRFTCGLLPVSCFCLGRVQGRSLFCALALWNGDDERALGVSKHVAGKAQRLEKEQTCIHGFPCLVLGITSRMEWLRPNPAMQTMDLYMQQCLTVHIRRAECCRMRQAGHDKDCHSRHAALNCRCKLDDQASGPLAAQTRAG